MRRTLWLSAGMALGATGSLWARRRLEHLSERARTEGLRPELASVASIAGRGARAGAAHVKRAVSSGRASARLREEELWQELELRAREP